MNRLIRFTDGLVRGTNAVAAAVTVTIFVVMATQIVFRSGLNRALFWADELAVWCLAWLAMLACVGLAWDWRHVHVPMGVLALPPRWRALVIILSKAISVAFLAVMVWYGFQVFGATFHRVSQGLGLSTRWLKLAIPLSALLMAFVIAVAMLRDVLAWRAGDAAAFAKYGREESAD